MHRVNLHYITEASADGKYILVGVRWREMDLALSKVTSVEISVVNRNCVIAPKNHLLCVVLQ